MDGRCGHVPAGGGPAIELSGLTKRYRRGKGWFTAVNDVTLYFGRLKGLRTAEIRPRAERLLTSLGLWERRNETVGSFSRGMQQKVAIAAALITDPPILLLDEPTIGLDVEAARTVKEWIGHLAADEGKTIVLTTHQLAIVQELAGRIAVIRNGEIIADLPTRELLSKFAEDRFEVRVAGQAGGLAGKLPAGARAETGADTTRVVLPDADQGRLHEFLEELRASGVPLLAVTQAQPDLEEVFLRLIGSGDPAASRHSGEEDERAVVSP